MLQTSSQTESVPVNNYVVKRVTSQQECDALQGDGPTLTFSQEACTCFSAIKCRKGCAYGQQLDPRESCSCIEKGEYDAIFNHALSDKCLPDNIGIDLDFLQSEGITIINMFNFYGPIYGDIVGVGDGELAVHSDEDGNDAQESEAASTYSESDEDELLVVDPPVVVEPPVI